MKWNSLYLARTPDQTNKHTNKWEIDLLFSIYLTGSKCSEPELYFFFIAESSWLSLCSLWHTSTVSNSDYCSLLLPWTKEGIQWLRGHNFVLFWPPPTSTWTFLTLNWHFFDHLPTLHVHVVIECPQTPTLHCTTVHIGWGRILTIILSWIV